ncbi:M48 family metalloprotease [Candidatus Micrarchaeota archaeon]|nr:M48 family metalloprotease [Candidatus Micrarchaeota archaeon]
MGKLEIAVLIAFIALFFSSIIKEPADVTELRSRAWNLNCSEPVCILSKAQMGVWVDQGLLAETKGEVMNGSVKQALAFLLVQNDAEVRKNFSERIDAQIAQVKLGVTTSDDLILLANEIKFRADRNKDERLQRQFSEIQKWLAANGTKDFLYAYSIETIEPENKKVNRENFSSASSLISFILKQPLNSELLGPSYEQTFFARKIREEMEWNATEINIAEDICALSYYYSILYPAIIVKGTIMSVVMIYALPLVIICWMSVISYFTSSGGGKSESFNREYSKNVILISLFAVILFPLMLQLSLFFQLFPAVIYIIFVFPLLLLTLFYLWSSTGILRDYGMVKMDMGKFLITRYKESAVIATAGAVITIISIFVISNIQEIFAYMNFGVVSALAVLLILMFLSVFSVILFPRFIEYTNPSCEIESSKMNLRLKALAEKFGCNVGSIRVIAAAGSNLANAFQSGLIGNNVKLFIFETMLDRRKFKQRELEAIVAHELAHVNKKHILKTVFGYLMIACGVLALFVIIGLLLQAANLTDVSDILAGSSPYIALAVAFLTTMWMMRRFEFEADSAAAEMGYGNDLISALKKISKYNLTPNTLSRLVTLFSSHADLESRIRNLKKYSEKVG